jgi:hypothetical protein
MSQKVVDIVTGISKAVGVGRWDGAVDENGEKLVIGLKREEGNPNLDKRTMDGWDAKVNGKTLVVSYHSELLLKDVYAGNLESELEQTMSDIVSFLKKQYRKMTGNTLTLKEKGEVDARVEKASHIRVFVTARKNYEISNMSDVENIKEPSKDGLDKEFRKFLDLAATKRPKNDKRKAES